jgi:hypothetical protein
MNVYIRVDVWKCGSVEVWKCGSVEVWTCGRVDVWTCGRVDVCYHYVCVESELICKYGVNN